MLGIFSRCLFAAAGIYALFDGLFMSLTSNANFGNYLAAFLGGILICTALFWETLGRTAPKWLKITFFTVLSIILIFSSSLYFYGKTDSVTYDEDAIIVLGAGLRGERPSLSLKGRLDAAYEYHTANPGALVVVSGGKGQGESITEAEAMEKYLLNLGIPAEKIVKEEKSTSTYENLVFSKQILDRLLEKNYKIAYISNEYHIFRAGSIAKKAGFENTAHIHSDTIWHSVLPGTLRECAAVIKHLLLGS